MQDAVDLLWFFLPQDSLTVWTSLEQYQLLPLVEDLVPVPKARFPAYVSPLSSLLRLFLIVLDKDGGVYEINQSQN